VRDDRDRSSHPIVTVRLGLKSRGVILQNNICGMQGFAVQSNVEATCNMRAYTYTNHGAGYKYICGCIKRPRNHFISAKYKPVQSFKLQFLQNSPLAHLYTSAIDCKGVGNIPGTHFVKAFSALPSHS
jgi:hypothetical protein